MKKLLIVLSFFTAAAAYAAPAILTGQEAFEHSKKHISGILLGTELEGGKNAPVYEIKTLDGDTLRIALIDAETGDLIRLKYEKIASDRAAVLRQVKVSHGEAAAAVNRALAGKIIESSLHARGGKPVYKIEMADTAGYPYEALVDGITGGLISLKLDEQFVNKPAITLAQAEKAATDAVGGEALYSVLDEDDERLHYEVTLISDALRLYEVKVDAGSGRILRTEAVR